ncbi:hypothetical protein AW40_07340 [Kosakonia radicincitans UMEnt01/12]|uniref:hypothetical protein n=1 Tax=Kosakonia radicincitans TaxID=283686 RepID=UPI000460BAB4|nr:hypothetical protein [Kosakonia radicincitans]KDE37465.1 hypothetical protein AW40_07340 [Kosakonia radicincitans UMEnt01/12]
MNDLGITRYTCTAGDRRGEFGDCMEKDKNGRYVTFSQHDRQVKHLQKEIESLRKKLRLTSAI